ncbi:putative reverse transcriptase domain-containing protein [Tanacetum coccineum]
MTKLTQKKIKFEWSDKAEAAFQLIKQKLCSAPILALPEGNEDFIAYCDASIKGLGVKEFRGGLMHHDKLKIMRKNYTTQDLELGCRSVPSKIEDTTFHVLWTQDVPFVSLTNDGGARVMTVKESNVRTRQRPREGRIIVGEELLTMYRQRLPQWKWENNT